MYKKTHVNIFYIYIYMNNFLPIKQILYFYARKNLSFKLIWEYVIGLVKIRIVSIQVYEFYGLNY